MSCLRQKPVLDFQTNAKIFLHYPWTGPVVWKPHFDGHYATDAIFPMEPFDLLQQGKYNKVSVIIGANKYEGIFNYIGYLLGMCKIEEVERRWDALGPLILFHRSLDETMQKDIKMARMVKRYYFKNKPISQETVSAFIDLMGDHTFFGGIEIMIQ